MGQNFTVHGKNHYFNEIRIFETSLNLDCRAIILTVIVTRLRANILV